MALNSYFAHYADAVVMDKSLIGAKPLLRCSVASSVREGGEDGRLTIKIQHKKTVEKYRIHKVGL